MTTLREQITLPQKHNNSFYTDYSDLELLVILSSCGNNFELLKEEIKKCKNINYKYCYTWSLLMFATEYSNSTSSIETVKLLIENNIDVNLQSNYGFTALILLCEYSSDKIIETVKILLKNGANLNLKDTYGDNALIRCIYYNNVKTTELLLEYKANIYAINDEKQNALDIALKEYGKESEIYQLLLNYRYINNDHYCDFYICFIYNTL